MTTAIRTHIIKIGNSQGIRIPKLLLEQSALRDEVELELVEGQLIIRPVPVVRAGWDEAFRAMRANGEDQLLDPDITASSWDEEEWQW